MRNKAFTFLNSIALVTALGFLLAIPCRAQQAPGLSDRYTHAALRALHAIQAGESNTANVNISTAPAAINAAEDVSATDEERRFSSILHQIYRLKLHDDDMIAAYQRVIDMENFTDDSENKQTRDSKDYAASQLTDTLTDMQNREDRCFRQLETSLNEKSLGTFPGCSALIQ
jgi:hypothetical protein